MREMKRGSEADRERVCGERDREGERYNIMREGEQEEQELY